MAELKPCPFCGCNGKVFEEIRFKEARYDFPKWYVKCTTCGIQTQTGTMQYAVARWNRRADNG